MTLTKEMFRYDLPVELIAQSPILKRDQSRLMVLHRQDESIEHKVFTDILDYLKEGDVLVRNDTKVLPARLFGIKEKTGAKVEVFLLKPLGGDLWETLVKPGKRLKEGDLVTFNETLRGKIVRRTEDGGRVVEFLYDGDFEAILEQIGEVPLPPYIKEKLEDKDRYQTVYATHTGSVAAPTAGLHFTPDLLQKIEKKGVQIANVTLNVGLGTFRPVKAENILDHHMHSESYHVPEETARIINEAKAEGRRIVSVGTTVTRTLESNVDENGKLKAGYGETDIFIYPGFQFRMVDVLITNFHLPESTLLMLVSAFSNREFILKAYDEAVKERYRFFSFGDSMCIL